MKEWEMEEKDGGEVSTRFRRQIFHSDSDKCSPLGSREI